MPSGRVFRVFVSGVTSDVGKARTEIADDLAARGLSAKVQQQFRQEGDTETTLAKLDKYIRDCDAVVHIAGTRSGAFPKEDEVAPFRHVLEAQGIERASYTQWEYLLARHHGRRRSIYIAKAEYKPDKDAPTAKDDDPAVQAEHLCRLEKLDRDDFSTTDELCRKVLREDWPNLAARKPRNLPFASLGPLFKGRDEFLANLRAALASGRDGKVAVVGKALHGLGGVGKTRLAVEYALRHEAEHSALLFVAAETPERLGASLAALAGPDILDLPEKEAREDAVRIPAALGWLEHHPGWLMIIDNVDDATAAAAVERLLPRLAGGQVLITGRVSNFSGAIRKFELGVLDTETAAAFLLERTEGDREAAPDDDKLARELAIELGGLALGLEQAGAYIAAERISFRRYLALWKEKRETVLGWFDKNLMSYDHDTGLAATWATSVARLAPASRTLLERLAWLAPEPIPDTLLDTALPGDAPDFAARMALSGLYAYSLASRVAAEGGKASGPAFTVHRLVQDFTRRGMTAERRSEALGEALAWVNAAFVGSSSDVRTWPLLDPLAPHALALAACGDEAGIAEPTARLYGQLDVLFDAKARYKEAEHASRRALAIVEASYGPDHPKVATRLNNLAALLRTTNRLAEAEPLFRRALAIDETGLGPDHPTVAIHLNNLAGLLRATNRTNEAEPLYRRALAIDEASYGPDHPSVATSLDNLAQLLGDTNRLGEAEPLCRRALAIDEASYGPDHPIVAIRLNNLAQLLGDTNRLGEAEPLMRRALAIDEASYGPDHPNMAIRLNNLAGLLRVTNRLNDAEPLYRRALAIDEASYGPDHPKVATRLTNIAGLLSATNRLNEAEPLYRRALAIDEASYGPDHPEIATDLNNLANLLYQTNRVGEAEPVMRRALSISEGSHGPDHPTTHKIAATFRVLISARGGEDRSRPSGGKLRHFLYRIGRALIRRRH